MASTHETNPLWRMAYERLAMAANVLDALEARAKEWEREHQSSGG